MTTEDQISIELTDAERDLLVRGLGEWGGPAHATGALAVAIGFRGVEDMHEQVRRIGASLHAGQPLSRWDWRRALIATEIVFVSDIFGSGFEWSTTTGLSDEETVRTLRGLQYKLTKQARVHSA
ncbi:hypothetical protein Cme02nite_07620 [Catellatospora methionotrophica]|uniref:Uncharacterized protein n=1 Tax=Catellatospora methionotrophica TaxID=121620 RepID=A0A8J3LD67_9ACTN|nr:hypothetical protein [Catellatospora methionotrophica]GIG12430.1 hypothetical protein Cme02nite_07620 [Catellatospora methionotrophica]